MGKWSKNDSYAAPRDPKRHTQPLSVASKAVDPTLAALFQSSIIVPEKKSVEHSSSSTKHWGGRVAKRTQFSLELETSTSSDLLTDAISGPVAQDNEPLSGQYITRKQYPQPITTIGLEQTRTHNRRKRDDEDDVEGTYMQRLANEEAKEATKAHEERRSKRKKLLGGGDDEISSSDEGDDKKANVRPLKSAIDSSSPPPRHETVITKGATDSSLEQAARTVFLGNVSTTAITSRTAYSTLVTHLSTHFPSLPDSTPAHKISSLRFRSTPYATSSLPKKASFAKKDIMDATTKSTNAYVVYSTALAAREAVLKLNGTIVLHRHLRVDGVAHPSATDHRRCVFVGNLGFVDDESAIRAAEDEENGRTKSRKQKEPADVEEGLWRQFGNAGEVESVRVVRDKTTRVGKGFAYVQFKDPNAVERALLYNAKSFPPLLPRSLRVTRAKNPAKTASHASKPNATIRPASAIHTPKPSSQRQSLSGRAGRLLGRAGAAQLKRGDGKVVKTPERLVFEGYRARSGDKLGGRKGKKETRSGKRGAEWKKVGGKKGKA